MAFESLIKMVINEFLWEKNLILLVEILICKGLFLSKTSKQGSNAYYIYSITSSSRLIRPIKLWYLKVELEWLLMKSCKKNLFSLL